MNIIAPEDDHFPESEIQRLVHRTWILSYAPRGSVGAEFGVFRGHFAEKIAEILKPTTLFLVDPWTKAGERFGWGDDDPYTNYDRLTTHQAIEDCRARMKAFVDSGTVEIIEMFDHQFIDVLYHNKLKLDFVYLDTSHRYDKTLAELRNIDRVLSEEGVIMGDDWVPDRQDKHHGVFMAVNDFIKSESYEFVAAGPGGQYCLRRCFEKTKA